MSEPQALITSAQNPTLKRVERLLAKPTAYRDEGVFWLEGEHLCEAYLLRGNLPSALLCSPAPTAQALLTQWAARFPAFAAAFAAGSIKSLTLSSALFAKLSGLGSTAEVGFLCELGDPAVHHPPAVRAAPTVVLDRLQDAGNVGSILRSAAAFGFGQVWALKGTAALYAPKVLRAGMGAHFGLQLYEGLELADVAAALQTLAHNHTPLTLLATSSHQGAWLHQTPLPTAHAWVLGHEGQGVSPALAALCSQFVRIAQPGGEESLNVAAAAAICLHHSAAQALSKS